MGPLFPVSNTPSMGVLSQEFHNFALVYERMKIGIWTAMSLKFVC